MTRILSLAAALLAVAPSYADLTPGATPEETHQRLAAALAEAGKTGAVVTLSPGEYLLNKGLNLRNATLTGPGATLRCVNPEDNKGYLFGVELGGEAVLRDLALVGEGPRCVPVGIGSGARRVQIRHVTITGGTILIDSNVPDIHDVLIEGCDLYKGGYGLLLDANCSGDNVRVIGCLFKDNASDAIELNFPKKGEGKFVRNVAISGCVFQNTGGNPNSATSGFGVGIAAGQNVQITGCTFHKCAVQGVHIEDDTDNVTVSGCNFEECGLGCTTGNWTGGVHILKGVKYVTVTGNNFNRCRYGVSGLQSYELHHVSVVGNTFKENERGAWFMQFPKGVFQGNVLEDCGIAVELWRSPGWIISGNYLGAAKAAEGAEKPRESIGFRCFGYRDLVCTDNIFDVDVPFDHDNKDWYDQHFVIKDNVILRGKSRENGAPAEKHPGT